MSDSYPAVSGLCLTYGRPALLEEAIYSFLQQEYPGPRELVVLNDYPRQTLRFDHPDVVIVNVPYRFRTVGEKTNVAAALCSHDLIFVWDDDDLYLPHRLRSSIERLDPAVGFFTPRRAWVLNDGVLSGPDGNVFHSGSCWTRELFDLVGGYAVMGIGHDQEIEQRFEEARPGSAATTAVSLEEIAYIYRWAGTGSYHMSGWVQDAPHADVEYGAVHEYVEQQAARGQMPLGDVLLTPRWRADYPALVRARLAAMRAGEGVRP